MSFEEGEKKYFGKRSQSDKNLMVNWNKMKERKKYQHQRKITRKRGEKVGEWIIK